MKLSRTQLALSLTLLLPFCVQAGETREPEHARSEVVNKSFQREEAPRIRVATFNMAAGRVSDLSSITSAIKALDADIVAVQEVDVETLRSGRVDQPAKLAELTGLNVAFRKAVDFERGGYGLAIVSRHPVKDVESLSLKSGDKESRIVMKSRVVVPAFEHPLTVFNTHFDPSENPELRLSQARQLNKWTMSQRGIKLLLGDVNDVPVSGTYQELMRFWVDASRNVSDRRTWPAANPEINVDYIFTSPAQKWEVTPVKLSTLGTNIDWTAVTDHLPVVVDMVLLEQ